MYRRGLSRIILKGKINPQHYSHFGVREIDVLSGYASGRNIKIIHNFISNSVREGRKQSEEGFVLLIPQENKNLHSFVVIIALNFLSSAGIRPRQKRGFLATFPGWG